MANKELQMSVNVINALALIEKTSSTFDELTKAFRKLRNFCAEGRHIQDEIHKDKYILESTHRVLGELLSLEEKTESSNTCLTVGLQFIGNLLVGNSEIQKSVWKMYENLLKWCLKLCPMNVQNCAAMILYNIFLGHAEFISLEKDLVENIIVLMKNEDSPDFALYLFQLFLQKTPYIQGMYTILQPESRITVIEALHNLYKNSDEAVNLHLTKYLMWKFIAYSDNAVKIMNRPDCPIVAVEMVKILEYLTAISDNENYLRFLQAEKGFLGKLLNILKDLHITSKEPGQPISMIHKLSDLTVIEKNENIRGHPYYGFKCTLIRIIGNLCWRNAECQDCVRQMDMIPLLLDCCCIDGRNPFISQWTVLAIRNVCHNNSENQAYIAAMPRTGEIDSEKLEKLGIVICPSEDGTSTSISFTQPPETPETTY